MLHVPSKSNDMYVNKQGLELMMEVRIVEKLWHRSSFLSRKLKVVRNIHCVRLITSDG